MGIAPLRGAAALAARSRLRRRASVPVAAPALLLFSIGLENIPGKRVAGSFWFRVRVHPGAAFYFSTSCFGRVYFELQLTA